MRTYYINDVPLDQCPITQNDEGRYYHDSELGHFTTTIDKFDDIYPPEPYKIFTNGSHQFSNYQGTNIRSQKAYDIQGENDAIITCSEDVCLESTNPTSGSFCVLSSGKKILWLQEWQDFFIHTYQWARVGSVIKAGDPICRMSSDKIHLFCKHYGRFYPIRKVIIGD